MNWTDGVPRQLPENYCFVTVRADLDARRGILTPTPGVIHAGSCLYRASHYRSGRAEACNVVDRSGILVGGSVLPSNQEPALAPWWIDSKGFMEVERWCQRSKDPSATIRAMTALLPRWGDAHFRVGIKIMRPLFAWRGIGQALDSDGRPVPKTSGAAKYIPHPDLIQYYIPGLRSVGAPAARIAADAYVVDEAIALLPAGVQDNLTTGRRFEAPPKPDHFRA